MEVELVVKQVKNVLVLPVDGFLPIQEESFVDETVQFLSAVIFRDVIAVVVVVGEGLQKQRIANVVDELSVLVVGDFMHVHVERRDGHRFGPSVEGEGDILVTWSHGVGSKVDVVHAVWIGLFPVLTGMNTHQLALGSHVARRQHDGCQKDHQELFHGLIFLQRLGEQQRSEDMVSYALKDPRVGIFVFDRCRDELEAVGQEQLV